jgi:hypothetical protein
VNEDKRYDQFPYIRGENIVKLVGGPLHNQYFNWNGWGRVDIKIHWIEPMYKYPPIDWTNPSPIGPNPIRICGYRLFRETFWVMHRGALVLYGAYFTGFH